MQKDFGLILWEANKLGLPMPATLAAAKSNVLEEDPDGEEDFSAVIRLMEQAASKGGYLNGGRNLS